MTVAKLIPKVHRTPVGLRLLLVDDSSISRKVITLMLEAQGYEVKAVESGEEGLSLIEQEHYDAVLLDIEMPGLDGYSVLSRIRSMPLGISRTPVIAITGHGLAEDRQRLLGSGFDEYLAKPVDMASLSETVTRLTEHMDRASHRTGIRISANGVPAEPLPSNAVVTRSSRTEPNR